MEKGRGSSRGASNRRRPRGGSRWSPTKKPRPVWLAVLLPFLVLLVLIQLAQPLLKDEQSWWTKELFLQPPFAKVSEVRTAICLSGGARSFELTGPSIKDRLLSAYPNSDVFLVVPFDADAHKLSLLAGTGNIVHAEVAVQALMREDDVSKELFDEIGSPNGVQGLLQYFALVESCQAAITAHERTHRFRYAYVLRTRPDGFWNAPPPPLSTFERDTYYAPNGVDFDGVNDRLGLGGRRIMSKMLARSSTRSELYAAGLRNANSEIALKAQLKIRGVKLARLDFPFCVITRRTFPFVDRPEEVPVVPIGSAVTLNGVYCKPCTPMLAGQRAFDKMGGYRKSLRWFGTPRAGAEICNSTAEWERNWERAFDAKVGPQLAAARHAFRNETFDACKRRVANFVQEIPEWRGPSPREMCLMSFLGKPRRVKGVMMYVQLLRGPADARSTSFALGRNSPLGIALANGPGLQKARGGMEPVTSVECLVVELGNCVLDGASTLEEAISALRGYLSKAEDAAWSQAIAVMADGGEAVRQRARQELAKVLSAELTGPTGGLMCEKRKVDRFQGARTRATTVEDLPPYFPLRDKSPEERVQKYKERVQNWSLMETCEVFEAAITDPTTGPDDREKLKEFLQAKHYRPAEERLLALRRATRAFSAVAEAQRRVVEGRAMGQHGGLAVAQLRDAQGPAVAQLQDGGGSAGAQQAPRCGMLGCMLKGRGCFPDVDPEEPQWTSCEPCGKRKRGGDAASSSTPTQQGSWSGSDAFGPGSLGQSSFEQNSSGLGSFGQGSWGKSSFEKGLSGQGSSGHDLSLELYLLESETEAGQGSFEQTLSFGYLLESETEGGQGSSGQDFSFGYLLESETEAAADPQHGRPSSEDSKLQLALNEEEEEEEEESETDAEHDDVSKSDSDDDDAPEAGGQGVAPQGPQGDPPDNGGGGVPYTEDFGGRDLHPAEFGGARDYGYKRAADSEGPRHVICGQRTGFTWAGSGPRRRSLGAAAGNAAAKACLASSSDKVVKSSSDGALSALEERLQRVLIDEEDADSGSAESGSAEPTGGRRLPELPPIRMRQSDDRRGLLAVLPAVLPPKAATYVTERDAAAVQRNSNDAKSSLPIAVPQRPSLPCQDEKNVPPTARELFLASLKPCTLTPFESALASALELLDASDVRNGLANLAQLLAPGRRSDILGVNAAALSHVVSALITGLDRPDAATWQQRELLVTCLLEVSENTRLVPLVKRPVPPFNVPGTRRIVSALWRAFMAVKQTGWPDRDGTPALIRVLANLAASDLECHHEISRHGGLCLVQGLVTLASQPDDREPSDPVRKPSEAVRTRQHAYQWRREVINEGTRALNFILPTWGKQQTGGSLGGAREEKKLTQKRLEAASEALRVMALEGKSASVHVEALDIKKDSCPLEAVAGFTHGGTFCPDRNLGVWCTDYLRDQVQELKQLLMRPAGIDAPPPVQLEALLKGTPAGNETHCTQTEETMEQRASKAAEKDTLTLAVQLQMAKEKARRYQKELQAAYDLLDRGTSASCVNQALVAFFSDAGVSAKPSTEPFDNFPTGCLCPVCHQVLNLAVILESGFSCCAACTDNLFGGQETAKCPVTQALIHRSRVIQNEGLRLTIKNWEESALEWLTKQRALLGAPAPPLAPQHVFSARAEATRPPVGSPRARRLSRDVRRPEGADRARVTLPQSPLKKVEGFLLR
ncbi:RING/FYVE/PHD zinc finger superfamily protein [Klebsormidium nitens]|uniref:RING/FYVE/PHD zinc finger superfamily protein n=1 Tax=Klebsormidium nitens TaxID=105231 RepID=A0A1Y1IAM9_KLENI|nr:RING/FYVE/PHD zinc finger superfamily protein [Klebsormidium nitens]|eukprot:GAQ85767.1 RING/FYVE/PHD zinc finger superfamily protein [Klebsormidium nitens]